MNIREWVDHYRWQGVDKIFLIDNGSTDNARSLIEEDIASGFIEYQVRTEPHRQVEHYQAIYREARIYEKVEWLLVADLDEFVYSPLGTLKPALQILSPDADLIYMNWRVFGSNGHIHQPDSVRCAFTTRRPELARHCNSKWLCRTACINDPRVIGLHKVEGIHSSRTISENEILRMNHYIIQSVQYFKEVKMTRGDASNRVSDGIRDMRYFNEINQNMSMLDEDLARMVASSST